MITSKVKCPARGCLGRLGDFESIQKSCQGMLERFGDYQPGYTPLVIQVKSDALPGDV